MDDKPQIPQPIATIPRVPLWTALAVPPGVTVVSTFIASRYASAYGGTLLLVPIIVFFLIIALLPFFNQTVGMRYRGRSMVFLNWCYGLGQMICCLFLWLGTCVTIVYSQ